MNEPERVITGQKSYQHRANVKKFLNYWRVYLCKHGAEETRRCLKNGKTKALNRKDRIGLMQALGLES